MIWGCAGDFFKVLLKFKMAATDQFQFFGGRKNLNLSSHSQQHVDVQVPKFKMAARSQLQNFLWAQKL